MRTLLIPLLLGAAAALLTYFSRTSPSGDPSVRRPDKRWNDPKRALVRAINALRAALEGTKQADSAIAGLTTALTRAQARGQEGKPPLTDLKTVAGEARHELERAVASLENAIELTQRARELAPKPAWPESGQQDLQTALQELTSAGENLADAERALPTYRAASLAEIEETLQLVNAAATGPPAAIGRIAIVSNQLDSADRTTTFGEFGRLLPRRFSALGPIAYTSRWLRDLDRSVGRVLAIAVVVVLIVGFGLIGLALLHADRWILAIPAAALFAVALLLFLLEERAWAAVAVAAVAPAVVVTGLASALDLPYSLAVVGLTLLTIWLTAGAMAHWSSARAVAWILFVAIAFWSGALGFLRERGSSEPELEVALVKSSSSGDTFKGFFLGRTSDHVYLASTTKNCDEDGCRSVLSVPNDQATCLAVGPRKKLQDYDEPDDLPTAEPTEFADPSETPCEPEVSEPDDDPPKPSTTHSERNLSLDFDLDVAPRRSVVIRRPRRELALDFDFNASPRLSLFSGPSRTRRRVLLASEIFFRFGDDELTLGARRKLRSLARWMRKTSPAQVYIYGHADREGKPDDNERLSDRRARSVWGALVSRRALNGSRVVMRHRGETSPAVCSRGRRGFDDPASRVYNRRVEIYTERRPPANRLHCDG